VNASLALANLPEHQTRGVKLQLEFAWILTNVSSGSSAQTQHVIDSGALKALTAIIKMPFVELQFVEAVFDFFIWTHHQLAPSNCVEIKHYGLLVI
jgi:hypothetical protein